jgi:hypothetical protein
MIRTFDTLGFTDVWLYGGAIFAQLYGWERQWHYRTFVVRTNYAEYPASRGPFFQKGAAP